MSVDVDKIMEKVRKEEEGEFPIYVWGNNVFIKIGSNFGDQELSTKYMRASIQGNIFSPEIYTLGEIRRLCSNRQKGCKNFLEIYEKY